jgi:hypothetical protein
VDQNCGTDRALSFFLLFVIFPIDLIWGRGGRPLPAFVEWWCHLVGVTDAAAVQTATGFVAGAALISSLYVIWYVFLVLVAAVDAADAVNRSIHGDNKSD